MFNNFFEKKLWIIKNLRSLKNWYKRNFRSPSPSFIKLKIINSENFQGVPVMNFTEKEVPFTRVIEHKWFDYQSQKDTIISYEYPQNYDGKNEPYYPIRDTKNTAIYEKYSELSKKENGVYFGGRLGSYIYYDMHQIIASALKMVGKIETETQL